MGPLKTMYHALLTVYIVVMFSLLVGCSSTTPEEAFAQYDYPLALKGFQDRDTKNKSKCNFVLNKMNVAVTAMLAGDYYDAQHALHDAIVIMDNPETGKSQGIASLFMAEGVKIFKGEPYERAMSHCYLGLSCLADCDYPQAEVAFKRALLADKLSKEEIYQDDFGLAHYLLGTTFYRTNAHDNARIACQRLTACTSGISIDAPTETSITLMIELGYSPIKTQDSVLKSLDIITPRRYPECYVHVLIDGTFVGQAVQVVDITHQAQTVGRTAKDIVQGVKGVVAEAGALLLPGGAMLRSVISQPDLRTCYLLPGEVHAFKCPAREGLHTITLKFFDKKYRELKEYEQTHYYIPVNEGQENFYLFRSGPYKHNVYTKQEKTA